MHCRKSLLVDNETAWTKKNHSNMFDVTMGSFDGAEVYELIGLFLLDNLSDKYGKNDVGLYRDDGLVLLRNEADHNQNGLERTSNGNSRNKD